MDEGRAALAALHVWSHLHVRHTVPVAGWSMWPLLRPGDRVLVQHGCTDIRPGDLVVYQRVGRLVVHRAVGRVEQPGGWALRTKGDNQARWDPLVSPAQVVGRVEAIQRREGTWRLHGRAWRLGGLLLCLGLAPLVWVRQALGRLGQAAWRGVSLTPRGMPRP